MFRLLKCEFKKFKNTYVNLLSFMGMLLPVMLVALVFLLRKDYLIKSDGYNWKNFNQQLSIFFIFLVGPIITSFIAVFSIFYEYQEKTMKNVLSSPNGRIKIIFVKIIYVSLFVILQYVIVALVNILCALILGFEIKADSLFVNSVALILAGLSTVILVPLMMFATLLFKSFIPGMMLTVVGTISNVLILNWDKSYLSPWATPADFSFSIMDKAQMKIIYPIISTCSYLILFIILAVIYFKWSDQTS
jgi:bacitracin transport system permease protein